MVCCRNFHSDCSCLLTGNNQLTVLTCIYYCPNLNRRLEILPQMMRSVTVGGVKRIYHSGNVSGKQSGIAGGLEN